MDDSGEKLNHIFSGFENYTVDSDGRLLFDLSGHIWVIIAETSGYFSYNDNTIDIQK